MKKGPRVTIPSFIEFKISFICNGFSFFCFLERTDRAQSFQRSVALIPLHVRIVSVRIIRPMRDR